MFQTKTDKTSEKELNKTEISNLLDKESKVLVIKLLPEQQRLRTSEPNTGCFDAH